MFRFKPVPFEPYGRRRRRLPVPRWLLLLLVGVALGGVGVILIEQNYLPPRLTASESATIRNAFQQADSERVQLRSQLEETTRRLQAALSARGEADKALEQTRSATARLNDQVAALVTSLPADPRGGRIEVRAGQFTTRGGTLAYDVVLTRPRESATPTTGVMQVAVAGEGARGAGATINAQPVSLSIGGSHEIVHGSVALPEGFKPRETTIRILDRIDGEQIGMRVLRVR